MPDLITVPDRVSQKLHRKMNSGTFYRFAFVRAVAGKHRGKQVVADFDTLTIGNLSELIARHRDRAYKALSRYELTGSESSARTAADHIFRCNRYGMRREELLGNKADFADAPFPLVEEAVG